MDETSYEKTVGKRLEDDKKKFIDTLKELPIIVTACKRVSISRDTYYRWYREDSTFRRESDEAMSQGIEFISDMSETQLVALIKDQKMPAIAMWLKHNRPRYGGKLTRKPVMNTPEMTPEEEKLFKEFLDPSPGTSTTNDHAK
jgi:hypothetical protein